MNAPARSFTQLTVRRLQPVMGAEIGGVDLSRPLTKALRDEIYQALLAYKVIYFRDQDISRERQIALGASFGELEIHTLFPNPDYPPIMQVKVDGKTKQGADTWHSDNSWRVVPPSISILLAYVIPSLGGDTAFSSASAAYEALSDEVKARVDGLKAVHSAMAGYAKKAASIDPKLLAEMAARDVPVEHPVVRVHPDTGERGLYVNEAYTSRLAGLDPAESDALLHHLLDQYKRPETQVRIAWEPDMITLWDNRAVVHYGVTDYDEPRHLERVTVVGTRPFGVGEPGEPHPLPVLTA